jgi:hypothetical protein
MRLKCELYKKEQDELTNKVIQILNYIYMRHPRLEMWLIIYIL